MIRTAILMTADTGVYKVMDISTLFNMPFAEYM